MNATAPTASTTPPVRRCIPSSRTSPRASPPLAPRKGPDTASIGAARRGCMRAAPGSGPYHPRVLETLARACYRLRRVVLLGWVVLVIGLSMLAGAAGGDPATDFSAPGTESERA